MMPPAPTGFIWPSASATGQGERVYVCGLGCLVLEGKVKTHHALAHPSVP